MGSGIAAGSRSGPHERVVSACDAERATRITGPDRPHPSDVRHGNVAAGFTQTPQVIEGCSELLVDVPGDSGWHARGAIGVAELPLDIAVEIEVTAVYAPPDRWAPGSPPGYSAPRPRTCE
jgi:hypothetical protein